MSNTNITLFQKLSFALAGVGKDVMYWIFILIYVVYLELHHVDPVFIAFLFLFSSLLSVITDPVMGFIVDQTQSPYGKFRPWILVGAFSNSIATVLLFYWPNLKGFMLYMYIAAVYMFWFISYTIIDIPYWSLVPAFGSKRKDREHMSAIGRLGALVGSQIVILTGFKYISYISDINNLNITRSFIYAAYTGAAIFITTQIILCMSFKPKFNYIRRKSVSVKSLMHIITDNDQIKFLIAIGIMAQICLGVVTSVAILYLINDIKENIYVFMISGATGQFITFIAYMCLPSAITRHQLFVSSVLILAISSCCILSCGLLQIANLTVLISLYVLCVMTLSIITICTTVMTADCVDYGEFKVGLRSEAVVFASQTISSKLGAFLALLVTGFNIPALCYMQEYAIISHDVDISHTTMIAVPLLSVLMLYIYLKHYKLNGPFFTSILEGLEELRQASQIQTSDRLLLRYALNKNAVFLNLETKDIASCIKLMTSRLSSLGFIRNEKLFLDDIMQKISKSPCGITGGVAIPHLSSDSVIRPVIAIAKTANGIDCGAFDSKDCDIVFLIATPKDGVSHLNLLGRLSLLLNDSAFIDKIRHCINNDDLIESLLRESVKIQKREL